MKKIYFLSDIHLGSRASNDTHERERKLCRFLDSIRHDAKAIYFLGDVFDFWFEYHNVVPKGYTRFLGKLSELSDQGIDLHFYVGNHDMWAFDYLHHECGMTIHPEPEELLLPCVDGSSQVAFIGHGDGLGDKDRKFLFIRSIFHSPICQWLFRNLFPADWGMEFGLRWAKASRLKHRRKAIAENGDMLNVSDDGIVSNQLGDVLTQNHIPEATFMGEDKEPQVIYAKHHLKLHPHTAYFIFGHRHIELDMMLSRQSRLLIIGEWMQRFTYAVWDGETMLMDNYED